MGTPIHLVHAYQEEARIPVDAKFDAGIHDNLKKMTVSPQKRGFLQSCI
ncbi:MAG: hypothetical protein LIQ30_02095 [Planctomycetes bacterium]|nr:hypothetical protein [Planctomycetota bacterium]MCC8115661.1 hypothetical protein [Planctomycetota bacterium]MCD7897756.1 hypothetical protein [Planctomycetaceae bacterium]